MDQQSKVIHKQYIKKKRLPGGAYGKIYVCQQICETPEKIVFPWLERTKINDEVNSGKMVVIKKFRLMKKKVGMDIDTIREIKLLQQLKHKNIIEIKNIFLKQPKEPSPLCFKSLCFVTDYMLSLDELIRSFMTEQIQQSDIKYIMYQILQGLKYMHENMIIHRDFKPGNILLNQQGQIKITDFGLARIWDSRNMTQQVCTVNYRAPEILFGTINYGPAIDIWAAGCVFAELSMRRILFQGAGGYQVMANIINILGCPNTTIWPDLYKMPYVYEYEQRDPLPLGKYIGNIEEEGVLMLKQMLKYNPLERWSAQQALDCPYFKDVNEEDVCNYSVKMRRIIDEKMQV